MAFGGGSSGSAALTAHTHNASLAGDGGDLSETLTDMNGVALYSLITDNSAAVAANTAAIAAIAAVPSGLVAIWSGAIGSYPTGWALNSVGIPNKTVGLSQLTQTDGRGLWNGQPRTALGQQFNTGNLMVGKSPTSVTWYLYKTGSPTGTVYAYIKTSAGVIRETSSTTLNPATLTAGFGNQTANIFNFAGTTALSDGDMITVEYSGGSSGNEVGVTTDNTGAISDSVMRQYTGSWADISGEALTFTANYELAYIQKS